VVCQRARAFDVPDFTVGEQINLVGSGPIRNMFNPSALGDANCYSSAIPSTEVHAAAGPGNHWFYLVAEARIRPTVSRSADLQRHHRHGPGSADRDQDHVQRDAAQDHGRVVPEVPHVDAAGRAQPVSRSCTEFNTVKAAWDAVSVPVQAADPTCGGGGGGGGGGTNLLQNPGFESGATIWTATPAVINNTAGIAHTGTFAAWLDGYGTTHTDSVTQSVAIPTASTAAQLCYWLRITTAETTTTTQFDKLSVQIRNAAGTVLSTLATFSNLNAGAYRQVCHNVGSFAGQTVSPFSWAPRTRRSRRASSSTTSRCSEPSR